MNQLEKLVLTLYSPNLFCRDFATIYSRFVLHDKMSEPTFVRTNYRHELKNIYFCLQIIEDNLKSTLVK